MKGYPEQRRKEVPVPRTDLAVVLLLLILLVEVVYVFHVW